MEITSGGTPGPRLADEWADLDNNVYGSLRGAPAVRELAEAMAAAGWRARSSSWTQFEVEREWVRLELTERAPGDVLVGGVLDPSRLDDLGAALAGLGLRYSLELWDEEGSELVRELAG